MQEKKEKKDKKEVVITGTVVTKFACVLAIIAMAVFIVVSLVRGESFVEIVTENRWIWLGLIVSISTFTAIYLEGRKRKTGRTSNEQ